MTTVSKTVDFLRPIIERHLLAKPAAGPLIIGISGPQGSGKSYLSSHLSRQLSTQWYPQLNTVDISTDDFYLTYEDQKALAMKHPDNWMLSGRGPPGTHDLKLLTEFLDAVRQSKTGIKIPRYDKSAHMGKGDRRPVAEWSAVEGKIDILIVEGWFNGFRSIADADALLAKWHRCPKSSRISNEISDLNIKFLNDSLASYEVIWSYFDSFVLIATEDVRNVYKWRLEAEHNLKAQTGGQGMSDSEIEAFVDRYMPAYLLYYDDLLRKGSLPVGSNLKLDIDLGRAVRASSII